MLPKGPLVHRAQPGAQSLPPTADEMWTTIAVNDLRNADKSPLLKHEFRHLFTSETFFKSGDTYYPSRMPVDTNDQSIIGNFALGEAGHFE